MLPIESEYMEKFKTEFPNTPYLDFWTPEDNYLLQMKKRFYIFKDERFGTSKYIFDPTSADQFHGVDALFTDTIEKQYLVIAFPYSTKPVLINQYDTISDADKAIEADRLPPSSRYYHEIIDLSDRKPYFLDSDVVCSVQFNFVKMSV